MTTFRFSRIGSIVFFLITISVVVEQARSQDWRRELDIKSIHIRKWPNIGKNPLDTSCKNTFDRDILVSMSILGFIHRNAISIPCLHSSFSTFLDNCVVHLGSDKWLTMRLRYFLRLMIIKSFLFLFFFFLIHNEIRR